VDEELLRALASNCGRAYLAGARATDRPWHVDEDVIMSDLGLPGALPPNNATLLQPPVDRGHLADVVGRVDRFFAGHPGGGYQVWTIWPDVDLAPFGFSRSGAPCMVRDPGGEPTPAPHELELVEVSDDAGMREVWRIVDEVFCEGLAPDPLWDARVLSETYRVWLGRADGRWVTTATASLSDGFVGVYVVATLPEARGRGYGEAVSWAATLCRPELPATLQASSMGKPVYERMGYRSVADFTLWARSRRGGGP